MRSSNSGTCGQPLLGIGEQRGQAVALLEPRPEVGDDAGPCRWSLSSTRERLSARVRGAGYDRAMPEVAFVMSPRQDHVAARAGGDAGPRARNPGRHQLAAPRGLPRAAPGPRVHTARPSRLCRRRGSGGAARRRDHGADDPALRRAAADGLPRSAPRGAPAGGSGVRHRPAGGGSALAARHSGRASSARATRRSHDHFDPERPRPIDVLFLGARSAAPDAITSIVPRASWRA